MRILLDTTYSLRAPYSGTAIYLARLQEALAELDGVEILAAGNDRRRPPAGGGMGSVRNLLADLRWTSVDLPRKAAQQRADLIHHPLPALAERLQVPQAVTVHDLAFERLPNCFHRRFRTYAHHVHRAAARRAAAVICPSETTASDLRSLWQVSPDRIVVAPLGPGQRLGAGPLIAGEPRHFLYIGDAEPRKNLPVLLAAYGSYRKRVEHPLELVLAGNASFAAPGVRSERSPSPARLVELYAEAAALVHPSLYEGFGLTPLEAMALGTPVLAARSPGVTEVCGDAALYGDREDATSFANGMVRITDDPALRRELRERGLARAGKFSWRECARRHADAYSLALRA